MIFLSSCLGIISIVTHQIPFRIKIISYRRQQNLSPLQDGNRNIPTNEDYVNKKHNLRVKNPWRWEGYKLKTLRIMVV